MATTPIPTVAATILLAALSSLAHTQARRTARQLSPDPHVIELIIDHGTAPAAASSTTGTGVPLPRNLVRSTRELVLLDSAGTVQPRQIDVRALWPDGSLRWVWIDFEADLTEAYRIAVLQPSNPPMPTSPVRVVESATRGGTGRTLSSHQRPSERYLSVATGTIRVDFDTLSATPIRIEPAGGQRLDGDGRGIYLRDQDGNLAVVEGTGADLEWVVEDAGPIRAVLRAEGFYIDDNGNPRARCIIRYSFDAGSPNIAVDHTFVVTHRAANQQYKEITVRMPAPTGSTTAGYIDANHANQFYSAATPSSIAQVMYPHLMRTNARCDGDNGRLGLRAEGWLNINSPSSSAVAVLRDFAEQFPKRLSSSGDGIGVHLWTSTRDLPLLDYRIRSIDRDYWRGWFPPGADVLDGRPDTVAVGSARTHEMQFSYATRPRTVGDARRVAAAFEDPATVRADTKSLAASGSFYEVAARNTASHGRVESYIDAFRTAWARRADGSSRAGWFEWGLTPELRYETFNGVRMPERFRLNNTGHYNTGRNLWTSWARSGNRDDYRTARNLARILADTKVIRATSHPSIPGTAKRAGLLTSNTLRHPLYSNLSLPVPWQVAGGRGRWDTAGQTSDYITPLTLAYLLNDCRWAKDVAFEFARGVTELPPEILLPTSTIPSYSSKDPVTGMSMMLAALQVLDEPRLEAEWRTIANKLECRLLALANRLFDENAPLGMGRKSAIDPNAPGIWQYAARPTAPGYEEWAHYKYDHKLQYMLDHARYFGDDTARRCFVRAVDSLIPYLATRSPYSSQNMSLHFLATAHRLANDTDDTPLDLASAVLQSALRFANDGTDSYASPACQGLPFFALPHYLAATAGLNHTPKVFPHLAVLDSEPNDGAYEITFAHAQGKSSRLDVGVTKVPKYKDPGLQLAAPHSTTGATIQLQPAVRIHGGSSHTASVRIEVPADEASGSYRVRVPAGHGIIVTANATAGLVVDIPHGAVFGHDPAAGMALARDRRLFFKVDDTVTSFTISSWIRPIGARFRVYDPDGHLAVDHTKRDARWNVDTIEVNGRHGVWSFDPGYSTVVKLSGIRARLAFGDRSRLLR